MYKDSFLKFRINKNHSAINEEISKVFIQPNVIQYAHLIQKIFCNGKVP